MKSDVIIVGAGLAGLAAARQLSIHGFHVVVFDKDSRVGGRVQSDVVDGITLDRGFQLYNPAYPEAARVLDHDALDLRTFSRGVISCTLHGMVKLGDPRSLPLWAPQSALPQSGSLLAKLAFVKYAVTQARRSGNDISAEVDGTSADALRRSGVTGTFLDEVIAPFLAGVFLESRLSTSRRFLDLVLKSFILGSPALPAAGMQAIPNQLHAALPPETVKLGVHVDSVTETTVTSGKEIHTAKAVIVATESDNARLLTGVKTPPWNSVTTWYHAAPAGSYTEGKPVLVVNGGGAGVLVNSVALTNAVPEYAPGQTLISSSAIGTHPHDQPLREVLTKMYGHDTSQWELVGHYQIPRALPVMTAPHPVSQPARHGQVFLAGDYRATSSIQGAMVSGRRAADSVMRMLRTSSPDDTDLNGNVHV